MDYIIFFYLYSVPEQSKGNRNFVPKQSLAPASISTKMNQKLPEAEQSLGNRNVVPEVCLMGLHVYKKANSLTTFEKTSTLD
jgi:hypothetical protein